MRRLDQALLSQVAGRVAAAAWHDSFVVDWGRARRIASRRFADVRHRMSAAKGALVRTYAKRTWRPEVRFDTTSDPVSGAESVPEVGGARVRSERYAAHQALKRAGAPSVGASRRGRGRSRPRRQAFRSRGQWSRKHGRPLRDVTIVPVQVFLRIDMAAPRSQSLLARWWHSLHKPTAIVFLLFTIGLGVWGIILQPAAAGPPTFPHDPQSISSWFLNVSPTPRKLLTTEQLYACGTGRCRSPNNTGMVLYLLGKYSAHVRVVRVSAELDSDGSLPCPKPAHLITGPSCVLNESFHVHDSHGQYVLNSSFKLLWPYGVFFVHAGSYASIKIPGLGVGFGSPNRGSKRNHLEQKIWISKTTTIPQLSMVFGPNPKPVNTGPYGWSWDSTNFGQPLEFTLTDPYGVENDNRNAFRSGILLGIAGAAFIAFAGEIVTPLTRAKKGTQES